MPRPSHALAIFPITSSTLSFSPVNPSSFADHIAMWSGTILRLMPGEAVAKHRLYPRLSPTRPLLPSHTFARSGIPPSRAYGFWMSEGSIDTMVSSCTHAAPCASTASCTVASSPSARRWRDSLSSVFFSRMSSSSARAIRPGTVVCPACIPKNICPGNSFCVFGTWGKTIPTNLLSCSRNRYAAVPSFTAASFPWLLSPRIIRKPLLFPKAHISRHSRNRA